jgi:hypothetical protein
MQSRPKLDIEEFHAKDGMADIGGNVFECLLRSIDASGGSDRIGKESGGKEHSRSIGNQTFPPEGGVRTEP